MNMLDEGDKLIMNETEKKAFKMLSKEEQEEVIGGSDLTAEQCKALRSKVFSSYDPHRLMVRYGGPPMQPVDPSNIEKIISKKLNKPNEE